jgi:hypothetical protein
LDTKREYVGTYSPALIIIEIIKFIGIIRRIIIKLTAIIIREFLRKLIDLRRYKLRNKK